MVPVAAITSLRAAEEAHSLSQPSPELPIRTLAVRSAERRTG